MKTAVIGIMGFFSELFGLALVGGSGAWVSGRIRSLRAAGRGVGRGFFRRAGGVKRPKTRRERWQ